MPARRSSSETGQAPSDARVEPETKGTPGERRRAIPRPNLEAASKCAPLSHICLSSLLHRDEWFIRDVMSSCMRADFHGQLHSKLKQSHVDSGWLDA